MAPRWSFTVPRGRAPGSSTGRRRPTAFLLVCIIVFGYGMYAVFVEPRGLARAPAGARTYVVALGPSVVSQTFELEVDGLERLSVHPAALDEPAAGRVRFRLWRLDADPAHPLREESWPVQELLDRGPFRWTFPPVPRSARRFRLEVGPVEDAPPRGMGLLASYDDQYPPGALFVDGRERWGDLVFSTGAAHATVFRTAEGLMRERLAPVPASWLLLIGFAAYGWAFAVFIYYMAFVPGDDP